MLTASARSWIGCDAESAKVLKNDRSVRLNPGPRTAFRGSSEHLKVTERLTYIDANTIRYQFTIDDPHTWDTKWSGEYPMKRTDFPMYEYACHEGNYGMANILRAQRAEEEKARQAGGETK